MARSIAQRSVGGRVDFPIELWALKWWPTWCVVAIFASLGRAPYFVRDVLGRCLGYVLFHTMRRRRTIAEVNIALCFREQPRKWRREVLRGHFIELGIALFETAAAWVQPFASLGKHSQFRGGEHVDHALARGQGVILIASHTCALEMTTVLGALRVRVSAIYRRNKNPVIEHVTCKGRTRAGTRLIDREDMRAVLASIRNNEVLWISPDQDHGVSSGAFVEFFGNRAATVTSPARLASRTGASVLMMLSRRLPGRAGYEIEISPPLQDFPGADLQAATRRLNRIFEQQTYLAPAQYLWVHRRFKTRPPACKPVYAD